MIDTRIRAGVVMRKAKRRMNCRHYIVDTIARADDNIRVTPSLHIVSLSG